MFYYKLYIQFNLFAKAKKKCFKWLVKNCLTCIWHDPGTFDKITLFQSDSSKRCSQHATQWQQVMLVGQSLICNVFCEAENMLVLR